MAKEHAQPSRCPTPTMTRHDRTTLHAHPKPAFRPAREALPALYRWTEKQTGSAVSVDGERKRARTWS